jgi:exonuclease III
MELDKELKQRGINIAVINKTKKKLKGMKETENYIMIYSGVLLNRRASCGVAILVNKKWRNRITSSEYISERMVMTKLKIVRGHLMIAGVYAPEEGRKEETSRFYEDLQQVMSKQSKTNYLIIARDLNARVGNTPISRTVGTFGEETLNNNGQELIQFCTFNQLRITDTFFPKKDIYKYTWSARGLRSIIDYVIVNEKLQNQIQDVQVYRGSDIGSDHCLLIAKMVVMAKWKKMYKKRKTA